MNASAPSPFEPGRRVDSVACVPLQRRVRPGTELARLDHPVIVNAKYRCQPSQLPPEDQNTKAPRFHNSHCSSAAIPFFFFFFSSSFFFFFSFLTAMRPHSGSRYGKTESSGNQEDP